MGRRVQDCCRNPSVYCLFLLMNCPEKLWREIQSIGWLFMAGQYASCAWPHMRTVCEQRLVVRARDSKHLSFPMAALIINCGLMLGNQLMAAISLSFQFPFLIICWLNVKPIEADDRKLIEKQKIDLPWIGQTLIGQRKVRIVQDSH